MNIKSNQKTEFVMDPEMGENTLVYNVDGGGINLANVDYILDNVTKILEYMTTDEVISLKYKDVNQYEEMMEEKFADFSFKYYAVFKKVITGEDITPLFKMLAAIESVQRGDTTLENVEKKLGEDLAHQYIYPKLNKKK